MLHVARLRSRRSSPSWLAPPTAARAGRPRGDTRPLGLVEQEIERARMSERRRVALQTDVELRVAARTETSARRELGEAARAFLRRRAYRRLGFVRLSDYTRERLGVSARTLQAAAWLAERLAGLPAISSAFDRAEISWTQARMLCAVASAATEAHWLELARRSSVEALERRVERERRPGDIPSDPDADERALDGEPAVRVRLTCPARIRALWRRAIELAARVAGETLADWRAVEIIAAEGFSGRPMDAPYGNRTGRDHLLSKNRKHGRRDGVSPDRQRGPAPVSALDDDEHSALPDGDHGLADAAPPIVGVDPPRPIVSVEPPPAIVAAGPPPPASTDPFALDARLVAAMHAIRTSEPRIGCLLRVVVGHRFYRTLGFPSLDLYVRERLGISLRKAWALLKVEKATCRSAEFARAYGDGSLSWARALALLPVLDRDNARAWIDRAGSVTVRRLCDEVSWVLDARDTFGFDVPFAPPPPCHQLTLVVTAAAPPSGCRELSPAIGVQIGAPSADGSTTIDRLRAEADHDRRIRAEVADVEIAFTAPASVVALFRDVLDAFAQPDLPRWAALERLLLHAVAHWSAMPRHRDPVFARDGWRCAVPACSSRRNLHDHHIQFRSRGGGNARDNRVAVCAAHHLHGLHAGTVRACGAAPHDVHWELGVRTGAPPLLTCVGERFLCEVAGEVDVTDDPGLGNNPDDAANPVNNASPLSTSRAPAATTSDPLKPT